MSIPRNSSVFYKIAIPIFVGMLFAFGSVYALPADKQIKDKDISNAIEYELIVDEMVPSDRINVETIDGIVTLSGTVANILAKDRVAEIANSIKGVRSVVNEVMVEPVERSNAELLEDVRDALIADPATDSYEIEAEVENGIVTLTGNVESWYEKQLASKVVKSVKGVKGIQNEIDFKLEDDRSDSEIRNEIIRKLDYDVWVDDEFIDVAVDNGKVTLSGTVGSATEKTNAYFDAWVAGVKTVDNSKLEVEGWAKDEVRKKQKQQRRSDAEIKQAIKDAFLYDPRLLSFNPQVEVEDGIVTLTGTVGNLKAKNAAERDARNTVGVWRVKNLLKVRPEAEISDEEIAASIRKALNRDPIVTRADVRVSVFNGYAYFYGTVDSNLEKKRIRELASGVKGVAGVNNYLTVGETIVSRDDWEMQQDIEDAIYWNPFVEIGDVDVSVTDGVATLTGTVENWKEYKIAAEKAKENAEKVKNHLTVFEGPQDLRPENMQEN